MGTATIKLQGPDGATYTVTLDAPPEATDEELAAAAQKSLSADLGIEQRVVDTVMDTEKAQQVKRARDVGVPEEELMDFFNAPSATEGMGNYEKYLAGLGQAGVMAGGGLLQTAAHLIPGVPTEGIDKWLQEQARLQEQGGLNEDGAAQFGNLVGNVAPWLMGGGPLSRMGLPAATATEVGLETASRPSTSGDYWSDKGRQALQSAAIAGPVNAGAEIAGKAYQASRNAPHAVMDYLNRPASGRPILRGDPATIAENTRIGQDTGIQFSPGQISQSPAMLQLEQFNKESLITRGQMEEVEDITSKQLEDGVNRYRASLGPDAPPEVVARKMQQFVIDKANELDQTRRMMANSDYGKLRQWGPEVDAQAYRAELEKMVKEGNTVTAGTDAKSVAQQAADRLARLEQQGGRLSGADIDLLTRATDTNFGGTVFDTIDRGYSKSMADRLSRAARQDVKQVPEMAEQLRIAKENYTKNSQAIQTLEMSGLGKIVGEENASAVLDLMTNKVSPEVVFKKFDRMDPTEMRSIMGYLDRTSPEIANAYRSVNLAEALRAAKINPATGGVGDSVNPGEFLRVMGVRGSGKSRMMNLDRMEALYAGTELEPLLNNLIQGARILADSRMANRSGTAIRQETQKWIESATNLFQATVAGLRKTAGTVGTMAGLKGIADRADPRSSRYLTGGDRYQLPTEQMRQITIPGGAAGMQLNEDNP